MNAGQQSHQAMIGTTAVSFLCGAAVGAGVALLYAPTSGRKTRAQIADKAHHVKDTAGEWTEKAMSSAHDAIDRVRGA